MFCDSGREQPEQTEKTLKIEKKGIITTGHV